MNATILNDIRDNITKMLRESATLREAYGFDRTTAFNHPRPNTNKNIGNPYAEVYISEYRLVSWLEETREFEVSIVIRVTMPTQMEEPFVEVSENIVAELYSDPHFGLDDNVYENWLYRASHEARNDYETTTITITAMVGGD